MGVVDEGVQGQRSGVERGGRKSVATQGTVGLWQHNNDGLLTLVYAAKKYDEPMILRWSHTNLGSLYTMVPSERSENEIKTALL